MEATSGQCVKCGMGTDALLFLPRCGFGDCPYPGRKRRKRKNAGNKARRGYLAKKYGLTCRLCMEPLASLEEATIDHVIPRSKGGGNNRENTQLAHLECNHRRGSMDLAEYLASCRNR